MRLAQRLGDGDPALGPSLGSVAVKSEGIEVETQPPIEYGHLPIIARLNSVNAGPSTIVPAQLRGPRKVFSEFEA